MFVRVKTIIKYNPHRARRRPEKVAKARLIEVERVLAEMKQDGRSTAGLAQWPVSKQYKGRVVQSKFPEVVTVRKWTSSHPGVKISWLEASQKLAPEAYFHTVGQQTAKLCGKGKVCGVGSAQSNMNQFRPQRQNITILHALANNLDKVMLIGRL